MHNETGVSDLKVLRLSGIIILLCTLAVQSLLAFIVPLIYGDEKPVIVVTFYSLKEDVEQLLCGRGVVHSLIPPGVDPHEYQLTTADISVIESADLIVSTGHTHFELEIKDMVAKGEIRAKLFDIVENVPLTLRKNPVTGLPNYHMPIRDPYNYVSFILALARALTEVDPERADCYLRNAVEVSRKVYELISPLAGRFSGDVIVDKPHAQYIASWLGFNVVLVLKYEEEAPVTPDVVEKAASLIRSKNVVAVFVTSPYDLPGTRLLVEEASSSSVPVVEVPSPHVTGAFNAVRSVVSLVERLDLVETVARGENRVEYLWIAQVPAFLVGFLAGVLVSLLVIRLRGRRE